MGAVSTHDELVPWLRGLLEHDLDGWRSLEVVFLPRAEHEDRYLHARAREHAARCEAELAVLDEHKSSGGMYPTCRTCADWSPGSYMGDEEEWEEPPDDMSARAHPCKTVRLLGYGYRFRPGYREAGWKP